MVTDMHSKSICFFVSPYNEKSHKEIETGILSNEFNSSNSYGFRIHSRRKGFINATLIEKIEFVEKIIDPFGDETQIQRIKYQNINFEIKNSPPQIVIFHPPNSYRKLLNQLAEYTNYNVSIESKTINLLVWAKKLYDSNFNGKIVKMNIKNILYDKTTIGNLTLIGENDLEKMGKEIIAGKKHLIKELRIALEDNATASYVDLNNVGKIKFNKPVGNELFEKLYDTFISIA